MVDPQHRVHAANAVLTNGTKPADDKIACIAKTIEGRSPTTALQKAWEQHQQESVRMVLDALILAEAPLALIRDATGITLEVLQAYNEYFFDTSVFSNRLERQAYAELMCHYATTTKEAQLIQAAMSGGYETLIWLITPGRKVLKYAPKEVLETMMVENMHKALIGRSAPLTSHTAKVALECSKTAIQAAANLQRLNPIDDVDALAELRLTLIHQDNSININTTGAPLPEDILR